MNGWRRPYINLASQPVRNRRFYTASFIALVLVFLLSAVPAGLWLKSASRRNVSGRGTAAAADDRMYAAEAERNDLVRKAEAIQAKDSEFVGQVNRVLARKSFSFVDFFVLLEDALPASSAISSMSPVALGDDRIDTRVKIVLASHEDLMGLLNKLNALKFTNVSVRGSAQMGGQIVSEIGLTYERTR
jgi:hypothetical protein